MSPSVRVVVGLLAILAMIGGSGVVAAQAGDLSPQPSADVSAAGTSNTSTTIRIELGKQGDAHWTVSVVAPLPDQAAVEAFKNLSASFEANDSTILSRETFQRFVEIADNSTSRTMRLTDVERTASVHNGTGRLGLSFTWRNFGHRDGSMIHVKDAFTGPNGLWLQGLTADQRLVISVPESFDITSAPKGYTNRTIRWVGPTEFEPDDFEITYDVSPSTTTEPTPTRSTTRSPTPSNASPTPSNAASTRTTNVGPQGGGIPPVVLVAVVVVVAATGVYLFRNGGDPPFPNDSDDADGTVEEGDDGRSADSTAETSTASSGVSPTAASDDTAAGTTDDDQSPIDRELLSDEEYVEALIERNGGRMKQANIVSETGWSNAKVSQLLSTMAEEGRIEKLRIGRENLISFPDDEDD